jgi:hypothetical protein
MRRAAEFLAEKGLQRALHSRNPFDLLDTSDSLQDYIHDPNLNAILDKLCKKDPTTKCKAMQEFKEYFLAADRAFQKSILGVFVYFLFFTLVYVLQSTIDGY